MDSTSPALPRSRRGGLGTSWVGFLAVALMSFSMAACGDNGGTGGSRGTGATGGGGSGATGGGGSNTGGSGATGGGGSNTGGSGAAGGGGSNTGGSGGSTDVCGGLTGAPCDDTAYCDFPDEAMCGTADQTGTCEPRPETCTKDCPGVCGCDGQFYCNACIAAQAGIDVDPNGTCDLTPTVCGGLGGGVCTDKEYCDYPDDQMCGAFDGTGLCQPRPEACPEDCPGVCGCNGDFFCNACIAAQAGMDVNPFIDCSM